jgi:sulfur-carrier protein adenylyltransferase/sulfurtransferase
VRAPGPRHPPGGPAAGPPGGAEAGGSVTGETPPDSSVLVPEASGETAPYLTGFGREELVRYARHFVLPQVGPEGQSRIKGARVLVVGAGGLGSPVALYLAAAGVGTLGVVDHDTVDLSNLQRQLLHGTSSLGRSKADSARDRLRDVNPHVRVVTHPVRLTSANALGILGDYDLAVDGSDNFPTRYLLNDACVLQGKPYVYGAVDRWEGHVSVFAAPGGPCYRCLFREPPPPGAVPGCAEAGVLGVLPGVVGTLQAVETVKLILGVGESLVGRLLAFDALALSFREVRLRRNPGCPVCGDHPTQPTLVDYDLFCGLEPEPSPPEREDLPEISPRELQKMLEGPSPPFLLDVREPYEWEIGNLGSHGALLLPMGELRRRIGEIPPGKPVVVYCHVGVRSALVVEVLRTRGLDRVWNLRGGYLAWVDEVDPSLPRY